METGGRGSRCANEHRSYRQLHLHGCLRCAAVEVPSTADLGFKTTLRVGDEQHQKDRVKSSEICKRALGSFSCTLGAVLSLVRAWTLRHCYAAAGRRCGGIMLQKANESATPPQGRVWGLGRSGGRSQQVLRVHVRVHVFMFVCSCFVVLQRGPKN